MTVTATPIYPQAPLLADAALVNATGAFTFIPSSNVTTNLVPLVSGSVNGAKIEAISATSTDTVAQTLYLILNDGALNLIMGTYLIPATAGTVTTVPPVDLLNSPQAPGLSFDSAGNKYLYVPSGYTLYVGTTVIITSGKQLSVVAFGATF
jgi:hypothetical protein